MQGSIEAYLGSIMEPQMTIFMCKLVRGLSINLSSYPGYIPDHRSSTIHQGEKFPWSPFRFPNIRVRPPVRVNTSLQVHLGQRLPISLQVSQKELLCITEPRNLHRPRAELKLSTLPPKITFMPQRRGCTHLAKVPQMNRTSRLPSHPAFHRQVVTPQQQSVSYKQYDQIG